MAKRNLTEASKAAAIVRKTIRQAGIDATVRSSTYSMGSSLTVNTVDLAPATAKKILIYLLQFENGYFDAMQDMYVITENDNSLPRVKYARLNNEYSAELLQSALDFARDRLADFENTSENYAAAQDELLENGDFVQQRLWRELHNSRGIFAEFWTNRKPRIAA